jgi:NAD+ synthase
MLPERDSSKESVIDAKLHAEQLGISHRVIDLTACLNELGCYSDRASEVVRFKGGARTAIRLFPGLARKGFLSNLQGGGSRHFREFLSFHRIKHRMRMVAVYHEAERSNLLVASCANRTEFETGFFVRYGDDAGDIAPIKHLYKTQVFGLGRYIGVPEEILDKEPSPDLFAGMKDEEIMGITYDTLDAILDALSSGMGIDEIVKTLGVGRRVVDYVIEIRQYSGSMRDPPASLPAIEQRGGAQRNSEPV